MSPKGEADFDAVVQFLSVTNGTEYVERFTEEFGKVISETCQRVAQELDENGKPFDRPNEGASLRFAAPVYRVDISTGKKRARRSSAGLWYVFYRLEDIAGIGRADTPSIVAVQHSAAQPFSIEESEE